MDWLMGRNVCSASKAQPRTCPPHFKTLPRGNRESWRGAVVWEEATERKQQRICGLQFDSHVHVCFWSAAVRKNGSFRGVKTIRILSILDFFIRFLASKMRFKRNGSYTLNRKSKTKPNGKKPPAEEKKQYLEPEFTKIRVLDFDVKELVVLPREIDLNEWLASNTTTFFNLINLQYSTISEFCTGDTCQAMTACNT
ncbi:unnamed protein product, partial [Arctogadus glacialis]